MKKAVSGIVLMLLLTSMLTLAFNIQPVKASRTIYIRPDGSIYPQTAPIQRVGDAYTFTDNIYDSIVVQRDNIVVDGAWYSLQGTGAYPSEGINLSGISNVTLRNVIIENFSYGINLIGSLGNRVEDCIIAEGYFGIHLSGSMNNEIYGNIISNEGVGIYLSESLGNMIYQNNMSHVGEGVLISGGSSYNTIYGNVINTLYYPMESRGIALDYSSHNLISNNHIINGWSGIDLHFFSHNNTLIGNNIQSDLIGLGRIGVSIYNSSNNKILNNNITDIDDSPEEEWGILMDNSFNNVISENIITLNYWGMEFTNSSGNTISGNTVTGSLYGIVLEVSFENNIAGNNITNNMRGIHLGYSFNNSISRNNVERTGYSGIFLAYSSYNSIRDNNITETGKLGGIILDYSSYNHIYENDIANNIDCGIRLQESSNNIVSGNNIANNAYGISLGPSSNNSIYHNNFINNTEQVYNPSSYAAIWDDGYPSGGNYWSDYTGADLYSGPYQNEPGSDGIGDTPYTIDANNADRYPLMNPWAPTPPSKFIVGDVVWATTDLHVRSGPGLNYSIIDTMVRGNKGLVLSDPINSDGYNWWLINYSVGVVGWSAEDWLELAPPPPERPRGFSYWAEASIKWAEERLGSGKWGGLCLRFVANAFMQEEDKHAGWPSALDAAREFYRFNQEPGGWQHAPKGALIFFDRDGTNEYGHVGIYLGNGSIIHAYGTVRVNTIEEAIAKPDVGRYLGWSYPPELWRPIKFTFNATWEGVNYQVIIFTNSTITDFIFHQPLKRLSFMALGEKGTTGYCNVTIPKALLKGEPWTVKLNGTAWPFIATSNETHSFIHFTYAFASTYEVTIEGTWVIPEFPSAAILMLSLIITTAAIMVLNRKRREERKKRCT